MKLKDFIVLLIIFSTLMIITGCLNQGGESANSSSNGNSGESFEWKMSSTYVSGSIQFERDKRFAELVNEMSNGQLNIDLHQEGEIISASELLDSVSDGTVELGGDWPGTWSGKNPAFSLLGTSAAGMSAFDYGMWVQSADGQEMYDKLYGDYDLVYFPYNLIGAESGIRSSKPIESLDDIKGLNIRFVGTVQERVLKELGGNPVNVPSDELYEALERGTIDAAEFSTPSADVAMNLDEVTDYVATPGWHQTSSLTGVMINKEAFESLPENLQLIVKSAAKTTMLETAFDEMYNDSIENEKMVDSGEITHTEYSEEDLSKVEEIIMDVQNELAEEDEDFKEVLESQADFMKSFEEYRDILGDYGFGTNAKTLLDD
ncbi:MAG TPA: TRAP transporter substrate-binding protein DctP [Virgibacillus sp.]|nr:TRAP transporter substrate-binding protein DctP [Virgibacillus sp.]HLR67211.1 TRAP transporter substrate-binding protein DctP [Virgibacillus sp.]